MGVIWRSARTRPKHPRFLECASFLLPPLTSLSDDPASVGFATAPPGTDRSTPLSSRQTWFLVWTGTSTDWRTRTTLGRSSRERATLRREIGGAWGRRMHGSRGRSEALSSGGGARCGDNQRRKAAGVAQPLARLARFGALAAAQSGLLAEPLLEARLCCC